MSVSLFLRGGRQVRRTVHAGRGDGHGDDGRDERAEEDEEHAERDGRPAVPKDDDAQDDDD